MFEASKDQKNGTQLAEAERGILQPGSEKMSRQLSNAKVESTRQSTSVLTNSIQKSTISSSLQSAQQKPGYKFDSTFVSKQTSSFDNERRIEKTSQGALKNQETVKATQISFDGERICNLKTYLNVSESFVDGLNESKSQTSKSLKNIESMSVGEQICRKQLMQHHLSVIEAMELLDLNENLEIVKQALDELFQQNIVQPPNQIEVWTEATSKSMEQDLESKQDATTPTKTPDLSEITTKFYQDLKIEGEQPKKMTKTQKQRAKKAEGEKRRAMNAKLDEANAAKGSGAKEATRLNEILQKMGLRSVSIPSDGDCLYGSIAHQINLSNTGSKITGDDVRKKAANYIRENADEFLPFMDESMAEASNFEKYCMKVENSCRFGGDWGTGTEVKAASSALKRPIKVIYSNGEPQNFGEQFSSDPLVITFHQHLLTLGEHYNSTEPIMIFGEIANYLRSLISEFLVYLLERVFGIYSFQRIVSNTCLTRGDRVRLVEQLLEQSESVKLRELNWESDEDSKEAAEILSIENFSDEQEHADMVRRLTLSFGQIRGHKKLRELIEQRRAITYDPTNQDHEKKLLKLWHLLKPNEKLQDRKTLQWQSIGFQGDDPATDFRGMGILGLENLIFYAQHDAENCKNLLRIADNEVYGFPFCIAGITFTALCKELLVENYLKNHFANTLKSSATIENFNQVYCRIFNLFGEYWEDARPENVMFFNEVKNSFVELLKKYLKKSKADLFQADIVSLKLLK